VRSANASRNAATNSCPLKILDSLAAVIQTAGGIKDVPRISAHRALKTLHGAQGQKAARSGGAG
jgi:hypothetical protein